MAQRDHYGFWTSAIIAKLAAEKTISGTEAHLLATLETLQTADRGCFACNNALASRVGSSKLHVPRMLKKLESMHLIWRRTVQGERQIFMGRGPEGDSAGAIGGIAPALSNEIHNENTKQQPGSVVGGMGLLKEPKPTKTKPTPEDLSNAQTFIHILTKWSGPGARFSIEKQAAHFRLLREIDGATQDRVGAVLAWYAEHIGKEFIPSVFTGEAFRKKFLNLEAAMRRTAKPRDTKAPPLDTYGQGALTRLLMLGWGRVAEADLCGALAEVVHGYTQFLIKLQELAATVPEAAVVANFCPPAVDYAELHLKLVRWRVMGSGCFRGCLWAVDSPVFQEVVVTALKKYGWDDADWCRFVARMEGC